MSALLFEVNDHVAHLTFNRPAEMNATSAEMRELLIDYTRRIEIDDNIRAVLIRGAGDNFMAGGNLKEMQERMTNALDEHLATAEARASAVHVAIQRLCRMPKPVIVAAQGAVAGMGVSIALAADLLIAADDAYFAFAFTRVGLPGDCGVTYHLPRIVGERRALELMLLGDRLDAAAGKEFGIVNRIVPRDRLAAESETIARRLANGATVGIGLAKTLLKQSFSASLEQQLAHEAKASAIAVRSNDHREGVFAFLERRKPEFRGC